MVSFLKQFQHSDYDEMIRGTFLQNNNYTSAIYFSRIAT